MPGLVPGIHVLVRQSKKDLDGRDEARLWRKSDMMNGMV
jgi:hypothetical protein